MNVEPQREQAGSVGLGWGLGGDLKPEDAIL